MYASSIVRMYVTLKKPSLSTNTSGLYLEKDTDPEVVPTVEKDAPMFELAN